MKHQKFPMESFPHHVDNTSDNTDDKHENKIYNKRKREGDLITDTIWFKDFNKNDFSDSQAAYRHWNGQDEEYYGDEDEIIDEANVQFEGFPCKPVMEYDIDLKEKGPEESPHKGNPLLSIDSDSLVEF